ncbi:MAG: DUF998 domain-containing protein [Dehalococcoidales bacterium]|jgi:hypothetical protein
MQDFFKDGSDFVLTRSKKAVAELNVRLSAFTGRLNGYSAMAVAGMLGPLLLIIGDLTAGFSTHGYNMVRDSISSLALTPIGWLQTIGFLALGLLIEIFAAGLLFNIKQARWFHAGVALFVLFGFAMLLIGAFRTDPVGMARTIEGRIHGQTATLTFSLFPVAVLCFIPSIKRDENWRDLYRYSGVTFILAVVLLIIVRVTQEGSGWFGLAERLLVANMVFWVEVAAIKLFMLSLRRGKKAPSAS